MHLPASRQTSQLHSGSPTSASRPLTSADPARAGKRKGRQRLSYRSLSELRDRILPAQTERYHQSADGLFRTVQLGLRANLPAEVLRAAVRLTEIDHLPERAQVCHALVLRKLSRHEEALAVLTRWLKEHPESRLALTHVSGLYTILGKPLDAERSMRKALALHHGPSLTSELDQLDDLVGGEVAYLDEERRRALLTCGWHPSLWQARVALRAGDRQAIVDRYRHFLAGTKAADYANALCIAASDLAMAEAHGVAIEVIAPRYLVGQHSPLIGLNLLGADLAAGQHEHAAKLLAQLRLRFHDLLPNHLNHLADRLKHLGDELESGTGGAVAMIDSPTPLWWLYCARPAWLLKPAAPAGAWGVTYLISARQGDRSSSLDSQTLGGFALGAQLYLRDTFALRYGPQHRALIGVRPQVGMAEISEPWTRTELQGLTDELSGSRWVVTGVLSSAKQRVSLRLNVLDAATSQPLLDEEISDACDELSAGGVANDGLGRLMLKAVERLQAFYAAQGMPDAANGTAVALTEDPQRAFAQLTAHGRLCQLVLGYQRTIPMLHPQSVLAWLLRQAEQAPTDAHMRLILYCALLADHASGSLLYTDFKHRVLKLVNDTDERDLACASLSPLMVALYAADAFATDGAPQALLRDARYRDWMSALEQQQSMVLIEDDELESDSENEHEALESA